MTINIAEVLNAVSMIPGLFLVYYALKKKKFKVKIPLYAYYILCSASIIYHSYKSIKIKDEYTHTLFKLDIFAQQIMIYACILSSPYGIQGSLMVLPLSFTCLYLCDMKIEDQQKLGMITHALSLLSCAFILDYRISVLWIIAMSIFSQKEAFPKTAGVLWHSLNHTCTYYTWVALDKMNEIGFL